MMELSIFSMATLVLFITTLISIMIPPCLSLDDQPHLKVLSTSHDHHHQQAVNIDKESTLTKLPRKLMKPNIEAKTNVINVNGGHISGDNFIHDDTNKNGVSPAGHPHNHGIMDGRKGTRQHWVESKTWQYFTMDYAHVRRRRPIHNKFMPFAQP